MVISKKLGYRIFIFLFLAGLTTVVQASENAPSLNANLIAKADSKSPQIDFDDLDFEDEDLGEDEEEEATLKVNDPLEFFNRKMYFVNDKLYVYVMRPLSTTYRKVVHRKIRTGFSNVLSNLGSPIRFINNTLQAKFRGSGRELGRFTINSTIGLFGIFDPAKKVFKLEKTNEDFAQTLGHWGVGHGFYIMWPVLGPSTLRGFGGSFFDGYFSPRYYLFPHNFEWKFVTNGFVQVHSMSYLVEQIDSVKRDAIDPYLHVRDAFMQYREKLISE